MEGKLSIWIKSGSFNHSSDLYIQVFIDDNDVWRTDDKDGFSPDWDSTIVKHIKGDYQTITLKLMDEDTCTFHPAPFHLPPCTQQSTQPLLTLCTQSSNLYTFPVNSCVFFASVSRDDVIATRELPISEAVEGMNGDYELFDAEGNSVGTVDVSINFEEGDVNFFDLMGSMLHKEDD